jgi:peptidyl-dipeptidase A
MIRSHQLSLAALLTLAAGCPKTTDTEPAAQEAAVSPMDEARAFALAYEARVPPVAKELNLAYWEATTTGSSEAFGRAGELELQLRKLHADPQEYARLEAWLAIPELADQDPILARQLALIRGDYAPNQIDPELMAQMVALGVEVEEIYSTHRGMIDGEPIDANGIYDILLTSTDAELRREAWEASKQVGPLVAEKLVALVKLRNQAAVQAGYADFYQMRLSLSEQDPATVQALFADMATRSQAPFEALKADLDAVLAERHGLAVDELMPWHYADPFFQEAPRISDRDLDAWYRGRSVEEINTAYFAGIGLEVAPIIERSDLYPKDGKQPSAYCTDVDREGDVRVFCNLEDDDYWMSTMLHELGHAVYDVYIDHELPWALRSASHSFCTEAVALLFGRLSKDPAWILGATGMAPEELAPAEDDLRRTQRLLQVIFARWSLVMVDFERELYANPEQDLNALWWGLVERHQLLQRPPEREGAADWATKIHIVTAPAYYHNYLMGEMMASQMLAAMARDLYDGAPFTTIDTTGNPAVGAWLTERIFAPGASVHWSRLIEDATGEPLTSRYFVEEYLGDDQG